MTTGAVWLGRGVSVWRSLKGVSSLLTSPASTFTWYVTLPEGAFFFFLFFLPVELPPLVPVGAPVTAELDDPVSEPVLGGVVTVDLSAEAAAAEWANCWRNGSLA